MWHNSIFRFHCHIHCFNVNTFLEISSFCSKCISNHKHIRLEGNARSLFLCVFVQRIFIFTWKCHLNQNYVSIHFGISPSCFLQFLRNNFVFLSQNEPLNHWTFNHWTLNAKHSTELGFFSSLPFIIDSIRKFQNRKINPRISRSFIISTVRIWTMSASQLNALWMMF